jgi:hypothetical protein
VVAGGLLLMLADGALSTLGLGMVLFSACGFFVARWLRGLRQTRVEAEWLRALPFPVRGYFRVLQAGPEEERYLTVRLSFRDTAPDAEILNGMLGRVQYPASVRLTGGNGLRWTARSGPIRSFVSDEVGPSNAPALGWMRVVIADALYPLHQVHPLRGVTFGD